MTFRIMTNGEKFKIQRLYFHRNWRGCVYKEEWEELDLSYYNFCNTLKSYKEAEKLIIRLYGTKSEIVREWRPA